MDKKGEKVPTAHSHPEFKVFRVFRGTKGEWGTFTVTVGSRRLHDRQEGGQWQVRLADNSNRARSGWFAQEPAATGVTSVHRSARWLSSTASRILSWRSPSTNCGYSGA